MNGVAEALLEELLAQAKTQTQMLQKLAKAWTGSTGTAGGGSSTTTPPSGGIPNFGPLSIAAKAVTGALSMLGSVLGTVVNIFSSLINIASDLGQRLFEFGKQAMTAGVRLSDFLNVFSGLPIVGRLFSIGSALAQVNELILDSFRSISQVGATFGGSEFAFRSAAARAGLTLEEFASVVKQNGENLAAFAGSTDQGAMTLSRLNRTFMAADSSGRSVLSLGLKFDEAADYLATYMGMLGRSGAARELSDEQLVKNAQAYVYELDLLTRATGIERREADKRAQKIMDDAAFVSFLQTIEDEGQREATASFVRMAAAISPELGDQIKYIVRGLDIPLGDFGKTLMMTGQFSDLLNLNIRELTKLPINEAQQKFLNGVVGVGQGIGQFQQDNIELSALIKMAGGDLVQLGYRAKAAGKSVEEYVRGLVEQQEKAAKGTAGASAAAELGFRDLGNELLGKFMPILTTLRPFLLKMGEQISSLALKFLPWFTEKLQAVSDWLGSAILKYSQFFEDGGGGMKAALNELWSDLRMGAEKLWDNVGKPIVNWLETYLSPWFDILMIRFKLFMEDFIDEQFGGVDEQEKARRHRQADLDILRIKIGALERRRESISDPDLKNQLAAERNALASQANLIANSVVSGIEEYNRRWQYSSTGETTPLGMLAGLVGSGVQPIPSMENLAPLPTDLKGQTSPFDPNYQDPFTSPPKKPFELDFSRMGNLNVNGMDQMGTNFAELVRQQQETNRILRNLQPNALRP